MLDDKRWPAITIQGIFLAADVSFFLAGKSNVLILVSFTSLLILFTIQSISSNPRFLYLYPVNIAQEVITKDGPSGIFLKGVKEAKTTDGPPDIFLKEIQEIKEVKEVKTATVSWDTWILRSLLVISIFFFYAGATSSYILAVIIMVVAISFPVFWTSSHVVLASFLTSSQVSLNHEPKSCTSIFSLPLPPVTILCKLGSDSFGAAFSNRLRTVTRSSK